MRPTATNGDQRRPDLRQRLPGVLECVRRGVLEGKASNGQMVKGRRNRRTGRHGARLLLGEAPDHADEVGQSCGGRCSAGPPLLLELRRFRFLV